MRYIKIFHQDGLIYFDQVRVADLVLLDHRYRQFRGVVQRS
ncbi:hypothetical protein [Dawidia soli]|nr:hypothetical protein [Dawidia soli]